jgi:hypothetical protein
MIDKIEIDAGNNLAKYLSGFQKSVEKLNTISKNFQNLTKNTKNVNTLDGRTKEIKSFYQSLGRDLRELSKSVNNLNSTDKMMSRHMKNISSGSGFANRMYANQLSMPKISTAGYMAKQSTGKKNPILSGMMGDDLENTGKFSNFKNNIRNKHKGWRGKYNYDAMDNSSAQIHGAFRNKINPEIDNVESWYGRRKQAVKGLSINAEMMTFGRDQTYRNRNQKEGTLNKDGTPRKQPDIPVPSQFHLAKNLGGNIKDFFGMSGGKEEFEKDAEGNEKLDKDGNKIPKKKKGIRSKIKGAMKSPLGMIGGIGGAAMLGKKLIDSSPMLQAMMKMLNTTFTLILRPIGDFIGGMLRPITMFMLKEIAIPMAKKGKGFMKFGEEIGNKILGFFLRPVESIKAAIILAVHPLVEPFHKLLGIKVEDDKDYRWAKNYDAVSDWKLQKVLDNNEVGSDKYEEAKAIKSGMARGKLNFDDIVKRTQALSGDSSSLDGSLAFGIEVTELEEQKLALAKKTYQSAEAYYREINRMEQSGAITASEADLMRDYIEKAALSANSANVSMDEISDTFAGASTRIQEMLKELYTLQIQNANSADARYGSGAGDSYRDDAADTSNIADNFFGVNNAIDITEADKKGKSIIQERKNAIIESNKKMQNKVRMSGLVGRPGVSSYVERVNKIWKEVEEGNISQSQGQRMAVNLYDDMKGHAGRAVISTKGASLLRAASQLKDNGKARERSKQHTIELAEWIKGGMKGIKPQMGDLRGLANGGVINEPIFGVGRSGQKYAFGESGREFVTPERNAGGVINNIININIGNVSRDADFDKLKPLIQRWILESGSKRGII